MQVTAISLAGAASRIDRPLWLSHHITYIRVMGKQYEDDDRTAGRPSGAKQSGCVA
jgi:hypothetical protein